MNERNTSFANADSDVNCVQLERVFPTQSDVIDSAAFIQSLNP